ncbi:alpha/beta hydrolase family protein [Ornithinimicrobium cavernae]|uniref:alpha/beta hydrolase family protein n=1 Tax=Ornithinimicrobium cavernae TaxID=2666047 RepID=UPI00192A636B|nr:alpha/beta hydrolase [Ornithinimicrobium cavernae]
MTELLRYGDHVDQVVDLREPAEEPVGVAVLVHGGYWRARFTRDLMDPLAEDLVGRGWAVANIEYRRVGPGAGWPEILADARAAVDLVVAEVREREWSRPVVAVGHSVGGQLALLTVDRGLDAVVALAPVTDLARARDEHLGEDAVLELLSASPQQEPTVCVAGSPLSHLPVGAPVLVVHGDADTRVPLDHSQEYARCARQAGDDVELVTLPGVDHLALIDPARAWWAEILGWMTGQAHSCSTRGISR